MKLTAKQRYLERACHKAVLGDRAEFESMVQSPVDVLGLLYDLMEAKTTSQDVLEFHERFGVPVRVRPGFPPAEVVRLRDGLLKEEVNELDYAIDHHDIVEVADALADIVYVVHGTALAFGIDLDAVLAEVHRSNMTKTAERDENGKIKKGPNFEPPDIARALGFVAGNPAA